MVILCKPSVTLSKACTPEDAHMRAVVSPRYGTPDIVEIRQVPKPVPKAREVLVVVHAAAVGRTDAGMLRPRPPLLGRLMYGLFRPPTILGLDFAGSVDAGGR